MFWPILISAVSFWSVALLGAFYFARRYVRAIEAHQPNAALLASLQLQLESVEAAARRGALGSSVGGGPRALAPPPDRDDAPGPGGTPRPANAELSPGQDGDR